MTSSATNLFGEAQAPRLAHHHSGRYRSADVVLCGLRSHRRLLDREEFDKCRSSHRTYERVATEDRSLAQDRNHRLDEPDHPFWLREIRFRRDRRLQFPYRALSVKGMQCQEYSCEPSRRGSAAPAQPGTSSLVLRGFKRGSNSRYFIVFMNEFTLAGDIGTALAQTEDIYEFASASGLIVLRFANLLIAILREFLGSQKAKGAAEVTPMPILPT